MQSREWVQLANQIPWTKLEEAYQSVFPSNLGRAGKPFRMLYGAQLIKQCQGFSDREVVDAIRDTPEFQYFMGMPEYVVARPFTHVTLVKFRERIAPISELIRNIMADWTREQLRGNIGDNGVIITNATAIRIEIAYPQDTHLLNGARLKLEMAIELMSKQLQVAPPRTHKREAQKEWNTYSRRPRRRIKMRRKMIKAELQWIRRDLRYVDELLVQGATLSERRMTVLETIREVYAQQDYMYRNKTHQVENRIVSLTHPEIRPIVRGKSKSNVEFGPKIDVSIIDGVLDIERFSFDAFNESTDLAATLNHYYNIHGEYPDEILADTLYRTRANLAICKEHGIKISGPRLGRKPKHVDPTQKKADLEAENKRGQIEREFSLVKAKCGLGVVSEKTAETIAVSVDTGIVLANLKNVLLLFAIPVSVTARMAGVTLQINYKFINGTTKSAA